MNALLRAALCTAIPVVIIGCVLAADAIEAWAAGRHDDQPGPVPAEPAATLPRRTRHVPPDTSPDEPLTVAEYGQWLDLLHQLREEQR